jgi:hypothetical protein
MARSPRSNAGGEGRVTPLAKRDKQREANLKCALGFLRVLSSEPELNLLHRWLDSRSGIGLIAAGMYRRGCRLSLTHVADGEWRAMFQASPMFAPEGFGVAPTPWKAVQNAAWAAMNKADRR